MTARAGINSFLCAVAKLSQKIQTDDKRWNYFLELHTDENLVMLQHVTGYFPH